MRLPRKDRVIRNHGGPIKVLLATFVGALEFVVGTLGVEKTHPALPSEKFHVVTFNKPYQWASEVH